MPGPAAPGTLGLLAGYFLRTTIVLALALVAAAAARRRPAALRHFILSSALAGLLLLPLLRIAPVGWRSTLVPAWMAPAADRQGGRGAETAPLLPPAGLIVERPSGEAPANADVADGTRAAGRPLSLGGTALDGASALSGAGPAASARASKPGQAQTGPSAGRAGGRALDRLVALLWSAGLAVLALRLAVGLAGATRLTAQGVPLTGPDWRALLARFLALVSLRRDVRLKSHPEVAVPMTWGWRRPVVLMPAGSEAWSEAERASALFHELSHVKRGDFLIVLLVRTSLAVFWWNPLGWVVYRRLLREQEAACDELVLRAGIKPSSYAASLLAFRRSAGFRWSPSAALLGMLMPGRSSFQERLAAILRQRLVIKEVKMKTKIMLALALTLAVALVGTARPAPGHEADAVAAVLVEAEEAGKAAKAKAAAVKTIVIKPAGEEGKTIEIVITEGDEVRTMVLDKPLTLTTRKDGGALVLSVDGKDIQVLDGGPVRLAIKEGGIQVLKEGRAVFIGGESGLKIVKEGGEEGRQIVLYGDVKPEVVVEASPEVFVKVGKDAKVFSVHRAGETDMLEKVRELQKQVEAVKAKKMDLSSLEESLNELEKELQAAEVKAKEIGLKLDKAPGELKIVKRIGGDEVESESGVWVMKTDEAAREAKAKAKVMVGVGDTNDRAITIIFTGRTGEEGRADYAKAQAQLKKELPEGYKIVEQKYDADEGEMSFRIEAPEGAKTDAAFIRKVLDSVKSTLKSNK